jgi:hypothetical protein
MLVETLYMYSSGKTKEQVGKYMKKVSSLAISLLCCIYVLIVKYLYISIAHTVVFPTYLADIYSQAQHINY